MDGRLSNDFDSLLVNVYLMFVVAAERRQFPRQR